MHLTNWILQLAAKLATSAGVDLQRDGPSPLYDMAVKLAAPIVAGATD